MGKYIKTEITRGLEVRGNENLLSNGYRIYIEDDKIVLEMDRGGGDYTTLYT